MTSNKRPRSSKKSSDSGVHEEPHSSRRVDPVAPHDHRDDLVDDHAGGSSRSFVADSYQPDSYQPDSYQPDSYQPDSYQNDSFAINQGGNQGRGQALDNHSDSDTRHQHDASKREGLDPSPEIVHDHDQLENASFEVREHHYERKSVVREPLPVEPPADRFVDKRRGGVDKALDRAAAGDPDRIGDALKRARLARRESIGDISDYLRIRPEYLVSLESCRYEDLPADAYVIGFLRTYAIYLGLDGKDAIDRYRREMAGRRRKPQLSMPQPVSEGRAPTFAILVAALFAALLIYALWYIFATSDRVEVSVPPALPQPVVSPIEQGAVPAVDASAVALPAVAQTLGASPVPSASVVPSPVPSVASVASPVPSPVASVAAQPSPQPSPQPSILPSVAPSPAVYGEVGSRVLLRAKRDAWVMVTDPSGTTIFDRTLKEGEVYAAPTKGALLTTGNARGLVAVVDGVELPPLSSDGRVLRGVSLDPEKLKARSAPSVPRRVVVPPAQAVQSETLDD